MICVDSSDYMRNGDFFPSRMSGAQEACSLLIGSKMQANPENTVGFLTMGGKACSVRETLTTDVDRLMASAATLPVGGQLHFSHGIQIAQLALSHRINRRHEARIVAFVGSPVTEPPKELEKLAKRLRKDGVAIDVIAFGVEENVEVLDRFVATADKDNNSHFVNVPVGSSIVNAALSGINGGDGGGAAMDFSETGGVDPNMDPELAMVLRMSLEEERNRLAAAAEAERMMANGGTSGASPAQPAPPAPELPPQAQASTVPEASAPAAAAEDRELTEEEQLELALKLSMEEAQADAVQDAPPAGAAQPPANNNAPDAAFAEALQDEEFMRQLKEDAENAGGDDVKDADKK
eukprot:CAMPEP_0174826816 /NCGR_PEP_ID=MMETSP1114-20130205/257_1 /TAXON_ID=312471 /ORGANISM="Neobodo designis, Strain CCAP 1951/1" /LENGTH=349 /DNA_ID=CAMNT_0016060383 /DNA_START=77 /DNA_END=1126 /DNA_ORIENTATION=+